MLNLEGLHVYRGPVHVLRGVNINVGDDEIVGLVGRNGAGKTTTIQSIMGLLPIKSGRVVYKGSDITRLPAHKRAKIGIGFAPEDTKIFADLTADENLKIAIWLSARKGNTNPEENIFAIFPELKKLLSRRGLYLSGGEKKMLAIGRALALSPSLLLLDESLEGLAPIVVKRFMDAVTKIKELGISILIAESNLTHASRIANRLYAIDRGEIIYEGDPKKVFSDVEVMKTIRGY